MFLMRMFLTLFGLNREDTNDNANTIPVSVDKIVLPACCFHNLLCHGYDFDPDSETNETYSLF